jgi:hypothetical protein
LSDARAPWFRAQPAGRLLPSGAAIEWTMRIGDRPTFRTPRPRTAAEKEALRLGAAIEHIGRQGNLDGFPARRSQRLALVATAARQGLLVWHARRGRYELTWRGRGRLRHNARARSELRLSQGPARPAVNAGIVAAAGLIAAGISLTAWLPADAFMAARAPQLRSFSAMVATAAAPPAAKADAKAEANADMSGQSAGRFQAAEASFPGFRPTDAPVSPPAAVPLGELAVHAARTAEEASVETKTRSQTARVAAAGPERRGDRAGAYRQEKSFGPGYAYHPFGASHSFGAPPYRFGWGTRGLY